MEGIFAGGAFDVGVSAGAVFSVCATGDCVLAPGASEVGASSGSVDVEVFVRYSAVCKPIAGKTQISGLWQFQIPRLGKKFWIR